VHVDVRDRRSGDYWASLSTPVSRSDDLVDRSYPWDDVEMMEIKGCIPLLVFRDGVVAMGLPPPPSGSARRTFRLHLETLTSDKYPTPVDVIRHWPYGGHGFGTQLMEAATIVLVVTSQMEALFVEAELQYLMPQEWASKCVVELVEE
jgi:hypothetical protein